MLNVIVKAARIYYTISPPLSGAMEGCSIHSPGPAASNAISPNAMHVRLTTLVGRAVQRSRRSRACMTSGSRRLGTMAKETIQCRENVTGK